MDRPWMTIECKLMWAIKIFLLPHHYIVSMGMLVGSVQVFTEVPSGISIRPSVQIVVCF